MPTIFCSFNKTAGKNHLTPEITAPSSLPSWYTPSQNAQTLKIGYKNSKNLKHFCQNLSDTWFFVPDGDSCCPWNVMRPVRAQHVRSRWLSSHSSLSLWTGEEPDHSAGVSLFPSTVFARCHMKWPHFLWENMISYIRYIQLSRSGC